MRIKGNFHMGKSSNAAADCEFTIFSFGLGYHVLGWQYNK